MKLDSKVCSGSAPNALQPQTYLQSLGPDQSQSEVVAAEAQMVWTFGPLHQLLCSAEAVLLGDVDRDTGTRKSEFIEIVFNWSFKSH